MNPQGASIPTRVSGAVRETQPSSTAAVASAAAAWIHDWVLYYPTVSFELQLARGVLMALSAIVLVAGGSVLLERALRRSGVLEGFAV